MIKKISFATRARQEAIDITAKVAEIVRESKARSGVCHVFIPHTTAGITINENADPSVRQDILDGLERIAPSDEEYAHAEGNADAHIKSTIVGTDRTILIEEGALKFGTWQGIFFLEFDGPRQRNVFVAITKE